MQKQIPKNVPSRSRKAKEGWQKVKLEEVAEVLNGYAFSSQSFIPKNDNAFPVFKMGNIKQGGGLQWTGKEDYFPENQAQQLMRFTTEPEDILMCMTDMKANVRLLGYSAYIKDEKFLVNQRVGRIKAKKGKVDPRFLFYYLNSSNFIGYIRSTARSGVQVNLTTDEIRQSSLFIPDHPEQKRIAPILSAFDDKIEVNNKIAKILEEMAQALFKEWFVKNALPTWEVSRFENYARLEYGKALQEGKRISGEVLVFGSSGQVGTHNEKLCNGPGIVVGRKGNVGSVFWIDEDFYPIDTTFYVKSKISLYYIYFILKNMRFHTGDSAVPGLNRESVHSLEIVIPDEQTLKNFENIVSPIFKKLAEIKKEDQKLAALRDLLLPKLMKGEILVNN